jgi:hypothetical protein
MNNKLIRWCVVGLTKHFHERRGDYTLLLLDEKRTKLQNQPYYAELRIDGPSIKQITSNYFVLSVDINVLISIFDNQKDFYKSSDLVGWFSAAYTNSINILNDEFETLGCFRLHNDGILVTDHGLVDKDSPLRQISIQGHYDMSLESLE